MSLNAVIVLRCVLHRVALDHLKMFLLSISMYKQYINMYFFSNLFQIEEQCIYICVYNMSSVFPFLDIRTCT